MLDEIPNLPRIWGEGALFAFSGMDGETNTASGFVATYAAEPYGLLFHTPSRRILDVNIAVPGPVLAATNDLLAVDSIDGLFAMTYLAWHTLIGILPAAVEISLRNEKRPAVNKAPGVFVSWDPIHRDALVLLIEEGYFALSYGRSEKEAWERAEAGLKADLNEAAAQRLAFYRRLPALADAQRDQLLKKCASVMKVNTLAAEGKIQQPWSTPDRVPHRHMWLWDSVFHSLGMNWIDPRLAWNTLKSVLDAQRRDGMIPHMIGISGRTSRITQPPILAWGVWENYTFLKDPAALEYALPRLERYLEWDCAHRDKNSNGLLEWFIEGDVNCRSGESGLDNSPRFDEAVLMDAVDFSTFAALDMACVAKIAQTLGQTERAAAWQSRAETLSARIHADLWDDADGFYYDRNLDGRFVRVRAVSGFLPLLLADIPAQHVQRLVEAIEDPQQFNTAFPLPSVSVDHPAWSTDMWRGATWINFNALIARGLVERGHREEADRLVEKTIAMVGKYYRQYGVLFEFFDAKDQVPPLACDRKGKRVEPYDIRRKSDSIRDYHWTAALVFRMLVKMELRNQNG